MQIISRTRSIGFDFFMFITPSEAVIELSCFSLKLFGCVTSETMTINELVGRNGEQNLLEALLQCREKSLGKIHFPITH